MLAEHLGPAYGTLAFHGTGVYIRGYANMQKVFSIVLKTNDFLSCFSQVVKNTNDFLG
jgi:hypothetical protein